MPVLQAKKTAGHPAANVAPKVEIRRIFLRVEELFDECDKLKRNVREARKAAYPKKA